MTTSPPAPSAAQAGSGPSAAAARVQTKITIPDGQQMVSLLGAGDEILKLIEKSLASDIHVRGNEITVSGSPADNALAERVFAELLELLQKGQALTADSVRRTVGMLQEGTAERPAEVLTFNIISRRGRTIRPKTLGQKRYVEAIDQHTIVFGIGPAGTGKTYLAMAKAVAALQAKQINRIILTRPAVEAGERLGFLPGTLYEKIDPYLRPLYDALHDMLDPDSIPRLMQAGTIEVAPLAYMRGRAQPLTATVLTPDGWRRIGDLAVGDLVVGSDGMPTPVLGVYPQGRRPVYRVTTQDGASTVACGEHLWTVRTPDDRGHGRSVRVLRTQDMIGQLRHGQLYRFELPLVEPVEFVPREVPIDPYALGLLLGDGRLTGTATLNSSTVDSGLAKATEAPGVSEALGAGDGVGSRGGVMVANPIIVALRELGLELGIPYARPETTFVPESYRFNSAAVRLAVLQGLLDSDSGSVTQRGSTCRIHYSTCSPRLQDDVVFLVRSLGGTAHWRAHPAPGREPGIAASRPTKRPVAHRYDAHVLDIRLPDGLEPFRLDCKRAVYRERRGYGEWRGERPTRFIEAIEPAGDAETVCIQVAAADSLYVTDDLIVTHNTLNDAFIILDEAQNTTPEQMKMFLTRLGFGSKIVVTGDITQVDLPGGTRSGLRVVQEILEGIEDVHFARLSSADVVRHRLVSEIVDAYEKWDAAQEAPGPHPLPGNRTAPGRAARRR